MELTKQQTIEEHRKMWNWIAEQLEKGIKKSVYDLKVEYCERNQLSLLYHCFCCDYALTTSDYVYCDMCKNCPVIWGTESDTKDFFCEYEIKKEDFYEDHGLWSKADEYSKKGKYKEAAELARQIANLPEK